ncbi:A/G-specific adenine glycosylase [Catenulispora pinistramenti]|uniref:A/G-specific adenine glycosylase n=1 Tax=Catenulispora pinistramenti TaxID=2705254 RepID=UPI001E28C7D7|nr:A/G-specific adenine glycosylase [Catenulispora pinistramenti]
MAERTTTRSTGGTDLAAFEQGAELVERVVDWFRAEARDLPWRRSDASAWAVMVSEFMLQQTPVNRVLPVYEAWLDRWPTPAALAAEPVSEAVRAWGRLGYPRRAQRLHAAATAIEEAFDGVVPDAYEDLWALPGVGEYTAGAIASFAYQKRHIVLDTNVRRVLARVVTGTEFPAAATTPQDRRIATALLPDAAPDAAQWAAASMELGAVVCTARSPRCDDCPALKLCRWVADGKPAYDGPPRRGQTYEGTDRQARGRLLAVLRDTHGPVPREELEAAWTRDVTQRERALASLMSDGLVTEEEGEMFALAH